ncbi:MAG: radical SAM protein [Pseudomonadota bacterium]
MTEKPMTFTEAVAGMADRIGAEPQQEYRNPTAFDGHLRIYPTLACNLRCRYCVNEAMGCRPHRYAMAGPQAWAKAINREGRHVVFTGGEPFLYPDLAEVINALRPDLKVRIYTNFCLNLADQLEWIARPVHFFISWHPQQRADRETFLHNLVQMRSRGLFTADIHAIDAVETAPVLAGDIAYFADHGFAIAMDSDQRGFAGAGQGLCRPAACAKTLYLIAPDGTRYQCVSRLVRNDRPMENILAGPLGSAVAVSECPDFGNCAPCDALGETAMAVF